MGGMNPESQDVQKANELYWESGRSVNQIAEDLGLSKGALYDMISPLASGFGCPLCESPMHYAHRTAHEKGVLTCSGCETQFEDSDPQLQALDADAAPAVVVQDGTRDVWVSGSAASRGRPNNQVLVGTAVLGVGVGLLIARLIGRR